MSRLTNSSAVALAQANFRASRGLAVCWWVIVLVRALVPAALTLGLGALVAAITDGGSIDGPLLVVGASFAFMSIAGPLHGQLGA
ncbi:MAG: hypothetical protein WCC60_17985, partial [Ilumatobacteraceae bacterium]